ncbi:MAG: KTSC domain-containing protein [Armatimonadetes bacterium]|nr:KTSC domain-containing protein [Armatimonadota bacterium]
MNKAWSVFKFGPRTGIKEYRYDERTSDLQIRYRGSFTTYTYREVPPLIYLSFKNSKRPTTYLNNCIKDRYQCDIERGDRAV